jgi:predicted metal-dependent hydrolase
MGASFAAREAEGREKIRMKKSERIEALVHGLGHSETTHRRFFLGYFSLFNEQKYYESHDVLEHLWLKTSDQSYQFFKGLIQLAGAFVHLQKQYEHPKHATHSRRLRPAYRLFLSAEHHLRSFAPCYLGFDVTSALLLCRDYATQLSDHDFHSNPWSPESAPHLPPPE